MIDAVSRQRVTVVIPFFNEHETLAVLYERLSKVTEVEPEAFEVLFVDDGSDDGSPAWVAAKAKEDSCVKLLRLSRNFGHQIAITAGLDAADGDAVVIMDADLQDPPEVIPELLRKWREGYQVVYAVRTCRRGEAWSKRLLAATFYRVFRHLSSIDVPRNAGDFRLLDRKPLMAIREVRELHRFVRGLTSWVGFTQTAIEYERDARYAGRTKYPVFTSLRLAVDALTSFSGAPLRWVLAAGVVVSALGGMEAGRIVYRRMFYPETVIPGWASLTALVLFMTGVQLLCIGLVGQYVSRIFEETKKRPLYFVRERIGDFPPPRGC